MDPRSLGDRFEPGPWHLGRWSRLVGTVAVVVSARKRSTGPAVQGSEAELEAVEHDLETLGGASA